jgi:hypothetical protein
MAEKRSKKLNFPSGADQAKPAESNARRALVAEPAPAKAGDEARIGQKTKLTRRWASRGTRPSAPNDQRRSFAWLFGAICPAEGKAFGIVMLKCNSEAQNCGWEHAL